jgi:hypothetical protein
MSRSLRFPLRLAALAYAAALCLPSPSLADDASPERAWFVTLKGALGKKAHLGRYGDLDGQPALWLEDRDKPKDTKRALSAPPDLLVHTACAESPPDPAKALSSEEGWWLLDSATLPPIALQLSFDGASLWRYDSAQSCLVRWRAPEPSLCKYGGDLYDTRIQHTYPFDLPSLNTFSLRQCATSPAKLESVQFSFTTDSYAEYLTAQEDAALAHNNDDAATSSGLDAKQLTLPVRSKKGVLEDRPFVIAINDEGHLSISAAPSEANPAPDPLFLYDKATLPIEESNDDDSTLIASLWRLDDGDIALQVERWSNIQEGALTRSEEGDNQSAYVLQMYRWDPSRSQWAFTWKWSEDFAFLPDEPRRGREARAFHLYPLSADASIAYRVKLSASDNLGSECGDEMDGCYTVTNSTRYSREVQWTLNVRGHDLELLTLKPKAITK